MQFTLLICITAANALPKFLKHTGKTVEQSGKAIGGIPLITGKQLAAEIKLNKQSVPSFFLNFENALKLKGRLLYLTEKQIIQMYSNVEPKEVIKYIFRDMQDKNILDETRLANLDAFLIETKGPKKLENIKAAMSMLIEHGRLDLLEKVLHNHKSLSGSLKIELEDIYNAAKRDHVEMVQWILESDESLPFLITESMLPERIPRFDYFNAAFGGSVDGKNLNLFKILVDKYSKNLPSNLKAKILRDLLNKNLKSFLDYYFTKITVEYFGFLEWYFNTGSPSLEILDYLLCRPEWNHIDISQILHIMSLTDYAVLDRLGREFLNPDIVFYQYNLSGGKKRKIHEFKERTALNAAIKMVEEDSNPKLRKVEDILKEIRDYDDIANSVADFDWDGQAIKKLRIEDIDWSNDINDVDKNDELDALLYSLNR